MTPWIVRYGIRMGVLLLLMLLVEYVAFLLYRQYGLNRLWWLPVSFGLVALAGYDTVKRLPLVWGALTGAILAATDNLLSWPIGSFVADGELAFPPEADPLLVGTSLLLMSIIGAIVAVSAGLLARDRRRRRSRRSALSKLAYEVDDAPAET